MFCAPHIPSPSGPKTTRYKDRTPHTPTTVVAYANDITIFVTSAADFAIIEEAIRLHERASGAPLKPRKSTALAVGSCCTQEIVLGIAYHPHVTILGVTF